jgi:hypothetical protein
MNILIGTPIHSKGAYVIEKFLKNQKQIQINNPSSELIFATSEASYVDELRIKLNDWNIKGKVLFYKNTKPAYAKKRIWDIVAGREAIRNYFLKETSAESLLFLDADMIYDPAIIRILENYLRNKYDVVFSGYPLRDFGLSLSATGCVAFSRDILTKLTFKVYEFKNGDSITADEILDYDLFRLGARVTKGYFLDIDHYIDKFNVKSIRPQRVGFAQKLSHNLFIRYCLIRFSLIFHRNLPLRMKICINKIIHKT